jgi:hypothetical protein
MNQEKVKKNRLSRRDFARRAALGVAAAACIPNQLLPHSIAPAPSERLRPNPITTPQDEKLSAAGQAEVNEKMQTILRKYGDRLSDVQKADIRRMVTEGQAPLEKMRAFPLDNSDQPGNVLRLFPDTTEARRPRSEGSE